MQFGVSESIAHWGKYSPDVPAVFANGSVVTYAELNNSVNRVCNWLNRRTKKERRIGIAIRSKPLFLVALLVVLRLRKSAVLLNPGLSDDALRTNFIDTRLRYLFYDGAYKKTKSLLCEKQGATGFDIEYILKATKHFNPQFTQILYSIPEDEWGVLFSSGSTGTPKGIERDHYSMVTEHIGWCLELGLYRNTRFYLGRPLFYTGGIVLSMSTFLAGGAVVVNDYANDNDNIEIWADYQKSLSTVPITHAFFLPDQIRKFTSVASELARQPLCAKTILTMGAPISGNEKIKASEVLGSQIIESWGNTESLGTITDPEDIKKRPNSIGRPFLTDQLYVVDEKANILSSDKLGRIAGGQEAGFLKYSNRENETKEVLKKEMIISEDIGYMDRDGYLYVKGRVQDSIVLNGRTLFLTDIEAKLRRKLVNKDFCVIAKASNQSRVKLYLVLASTGMSNQEKKTLLAALNNILASTEQIESLLLVKELPKLPSGKHDKTAIQSIVKELK